MTTSITAFFALPSSQISENGHWAVLRQDSWTEPELIPDPIPEGWEPEDRSGKQYVMNVISWPESPTNDGRVIVKADLPLRFVKRLRDYCIARGVDNWQTLAGLQCLDIVGSWAGLTPAAVKSKFPELVGTKQVDDGNGGTVDVQIVSQKLWTYEVPGLY